jgi:N-acetylglucosamine kinase-like BadF-type ATPase
MSGVSTDEDRQEIEAIAREIPEIGREARVAVENDAVAGLAGGLAGAPGLVLIAGTGSVCLGINERGERWFCGGWGALADDAGSAPWVGLQALHAAVRAEDGRTPPTLLQKIVFDYLDLDTPRRLISRVHNHGLDRSELGGLAPLVIEAHTAGDAAASAILNRAAGELTALVSATARRLFRAAPRDLILVGGLALSGPPFQTLLMERLQAGIPALRPRTPILSPAHGAALLALRHGGVPWTEDLLGNLALASGNAAAGHEGFAR